MTFFFPASASTTAASGNGRKTLIWIEPTFAPRARAQVVDRGLDVLGRRAERHEHRVGVLGLVLADQPVVTAGQLAEILVRRLEEIEDRLDEVVAARDDALHVVLLVLHGAEEDGVREVDHLRHAAALGPEEHALALGGAVDDVVGGAEVLANQLRLVLVERPLEVRREEAVHDVHARASDSAR